VITLTTDFGLRDPFVGIMKGVILNINPDVHIVDISHNISPHNIFEASLIISMSYKYFPKETIHVVVVDPGVGSGRRPILIVTEDHYFVGPDNGIFTPILEQTSPHFLKVIHLTSTHHFLPLKGSTFHGRDIFAPVAAWLSRGIDIFKFGEEITDYVKIPTMKSTIEDRTVNGYVIIIDTFGNAITNITKADIERLSPALSRDKMTILYKDSMIRIVDFYEEARDSGLSCLINSFGNLELFTYKGSASRRFNIKVGDSVSVTLN
jgi:hypothetical protein